jgi:flavin reductase (DIM6/NTAB) family NADH-FMN oxidoreductase RutF
MTIDSLKFRHALSKFPSGVTVISTLTPDGSPVGVTVSAFSSLSLTPPLILICLDLATSNLRAYTEGQSFCVNILSDSQDSISNAFAYPGPTPPFDSVPYTVGKLGLPVISHAAATLECRRDAVYPGGDHMIIVGAVTHAEWDDEAMPLIYAAGNYRALAEPEASQ